MHIEVWGNRRREIDCTCSKRFVIKLFEYTVSLYSGNEGNMTESLNTGMLNSAS